MTSSLFILILKCALMPIGSGCTSVYDPYRQPEIERMPILFTSYWTFNTDGTMMDGFNGQCNADCSTTANGTKLTADMEGKSAACISAWVRFINVVAVTTERYGVVVCNDAFGAITHREPHFNEYVGHWVVPVDLFSSVLLFDVVWEWSLDSATEVNDG